MFVKFAEFGACMRLLLGAKSMLVGCMSMARLGAKYVEVGCKVYGYFWVYVYAFSHIQTMANQSLRINIAAGHLQQHAHNN